MVHVLDVEVGILLVDQLTEGGVVLVPVVRHCGKARGERGERFHRGLGTRELLVVERDRAVEVLDRDQALVEPAFLDRAVRPRLRLRGQRVQCFARDPFEGRDRVGADPLMGLRVDLTQMEVASTHREQALLRRGHHLGPTADDEVLHPGHDGVGRDVVSRDPRAAEAVERHAARAHVVARVQRRHPTEVAALGPDLRTRAPHDVVHVRGVEAVPLDERFEHGPPEVLGMQVRQRALAGLADPSGRAAGVDDQSVGHQGSSGREMDRRQDEGTSMADGQSRRRSTDLRPPGPSLERWLDTGFASPTASPETIQTAPCARLTTYSTTTNTSSRS